MPCIFFHAQQQGQWINESFKVVSRSSDASTSSKIWESSTDGQGGDKANHTSDDARESQRLTEESDASPPKRPRIISDCKLSASEIDAVLTAEVPDLGLFSILKVCNSAATHDRLKEKFLKSRFIPSKTWVAPKRQCGQKERCVSSDFFNQELYPCIRSSVGKDALFCIVCILFGCQKIVLTTDPLTDWSNARRLVAKHEKTNDHKLAQQGSIDFLRICDKEQLGIVQHMTKAQYDLL